MNNELYQGEKVVFKGRKMDPTHLKTTVFKQCFKGIGSQVSRWKPNLKSHC
jgi:hypothetical protein